ncbi:MAG: beta-mannosidase [Chloroflexota bacterium]
MQSLSLSGSWQFREADTTEWYPASVPGSVHLELMALGKIPDPFVADNELRVQWVGERDWEYRRSFQADATFLANEQAWLVCDGLDTLTDVFINGQFVGHGENMFRQYRWDIKPLLSEGENEILLRFGGPIPYILARNAERQLGGVEQPGTPYIRKAPCHFGWDWGPKLPPIGPWKDIRLEGYNTARLTNVYLRQRHTGEGIFVRAEIEIERWNPARLKASLQIKSPHGLIQKAQMALEGNTGVIEIKVEDPQHWWPNGYGAQPLYEVEVLLSEKRKIRDRHQAKMGLRTIELRRDDDEYGQSFEFVVNGVGVFAKGSDWIPTDSFPTRISDELLEHLIRSSAEAHMNMLRVWGGGLYEEERFYDLCDRYGILIWQDFIFACNIYPKEEAFFQNFHAEAVDNIRRLRHRASLALWCGNNEMEMGWIHWNWDKPENTDLKAAYDRMYHHFIPAIVAAEDPDTPYWPSSPSSGIPFQNPNGNDRGDAHYWDVWHGRKPFTAYRTQLPRFMSEFGFQSLPPYETVCTYAAPEDRNMTSYVMEHHQRSGNGNGLMLSQMTDTFRMPKDFRSLVYLSMTLQAEGIRYGVEHWRRNRHRVAGTVIWQLNDCWPVASWASIDYFGRWKALHYAARRFYAPVLLSAEDEGAKIGLHVTNDLLHDWQGVVRWSLETLDGECLDRGEVAFTAPALKSAFISELDFSHQVTAENRRQVVLVYELWDRACCLQRVVAPFVPNKHLALRDPKLAWEVDEEEDGFVVTVQAEKTARFVEITLEGMPPFTVFSDNYFDLPAGRSLKVTFPKPKRWSLGRVRKTLRMTSLFDSF